MPIISGGQTTAAFFNAIQASVAGLLGTGGYYQTVTSAQVAPGYAVRASDWSNLATDINKCQKHQTNTTFTTAQLPIPVTGQAFNITQLNLYETNAATVVSNKYLANVANMTLSSSQLTINRATTWGAGNSSITAEGQADWGTVAAMNAFFNTGGELRWSFTHTTISNTQDTAWNTFLAGLTSMNIHGGSSLTSTTAGVLYPFNSLTTTYQTIFTKNSTTASYTANNIAISAKINAAGTGVVIKAVLNDAHTNAFTDIVQSGTKMVFSHLRSTVTMTGINSPTYTTITNF